MDTWITITQDDVLASINNSELTAALNTALASGQDNPLDTLLPDVTAEVRGYVRRRNTLGPGGRNYTFLSFLTSLAAQQSSSGGAATLPAGVHIDTGANSTPFTGAVPGGVTPFAGPGPNTGSRYGLNQALVIAQGPNGSTPGESMAWIRLSLGDLQNAAGAIQNKQIFLQEVPVCVNVGGTLTQMYQIFLCSNVYATSIG